MRHKKAVLKRGYYFPKDLLKAWEKFHASSKNYSPSAAGAFVAWMALGAAEREHIRKAVYSREIDTAVKEAKDLIGRAIIEAEIRTALKTMSKSERSKLLAFVGKSRI